MKFKSNIYPFLSNLHYLAISRLFKYESSHDENNDLGFRPGPTQTRLYSHRSRSDDLNFRFKQKRHCTETLHYLWGYNKGADRHS